MSEPIEPLSAELAALLGKLPQAALQAELDRSRA